MTIMSPKLPRFLTINEAATQISVSPKTIRRWIDAGHLHVHRLGRQVRLAEEDWATFLRMRRI